MGSLSVLLRFLSGLCSRRSEADKAVCSQEPARRPRPEPQVHPGCSLLDAQGPACSPACHSVTSTRVSCGHLQWGRRMEGCMLLGAREMGFLPSSTVFLFCSFLGSNLHNCSPSLEHTVSSNRSAVLRCVPPSAQGSPSTPQGACAPRHPSSALPALHVPHAQHAPRGPALSTPCTGLAGSAAAERAFQATASARWPSPGPAAA